MFTCECKKSKPIFDFKLKRWVCKTCEELISRPTGATLTADLQNALYKIIEKKLQGAGFQLFKASHPDCRDPEHWKLKIGAHTVTGVKEIQEFISDVS